LAVVLFVGAHPDDETLMAGVAIVEHVIAGHDVHVLVMSRSPGSVVLDELNGAPVPSPWWGVAHDPTAEGYSPLSAVEFGQARIDETAAAVRAMSSGLGTVTLHEAGLAGGWSAADAQAVILATANAINPAGPVWLKTHTYCVTTPSVEDHPEHIATGLGARQLATADPVRFGNLRHYILPRYWTSAGLADPRIAEKWDLPTDATVAARAINGARCYGAWAPPDSYAIGYHSVYIDMFAPLVATPKCLYHP